MSLSWANHLLFTHVHIASLCDIRQLFVAAGNSRSSLSFLRNSLSISSVVGTDFMHYLKQLVCYNDSTNVTEDTASLLLVDDLEQASWWQQHIGWCKPVFSAVRVTAYDDNWIQRILLFLTAVSSIQCTCLIQSFGSLLDNITCILLFSCFNESRYIMRWI